MTTTSRLSSARLDALFARIQMEIDNGHCTAAQVAVGRQGKVVASRSFGTATDESRFALFSATKPVVAMALLPHFADGTLLLTAPVAQYIPEFGHHGKADVTVLQLLTMQGGFPQAPIGPDRWGTSEGRRAQFAEWPLAWPAGTRTEYHPVSAHWVIGELLETLNGRSYVDVVHDRVVRPAGLAPLLGMQAGTPLLVRAHGQYPADIADLVSTYGRADLVPAVTIGPDALLAMNDPGAQAAAVPGGGAIATATDMATLYQSFLHNTAGALPDEWLADAIGTIRNGSINVSDGVPANRTIAGYLSGSDGYHLHRWMPAAPLAFGHAGAGGQLCWADPESGLSLCFLNDTLHQDPRVEFRRAADINDLVLGLLLQ
ncbi:MAG: serine hydrolase domain-containing protein [Actinomycetota bacterium]|nr:serine hydrolase domain-containing protein [Actinomycetota bacterium]